METMLVYKPPTSPPGDALEAMLHLPDTDLTRTRLDQEVFADGRTEGVKAMPLSWRAVGRRVGADSSRDSARATKSRGWKPLPRLS